MVKNENKRLEKVILSIGSNLGDKLQNCRHATEMLEESVGKILKQSSYYESEPWGYESNNLFINCAVEVLTSLNPIELLKQIKDIEEKLGRDKSVSNLYKDRIIDIDIIFYGNQVVITDFLKIPHILYRKRKFVILPMLEIVPEKIDPVDGKKIFQILQECDDFITVKKF